MSSERDNGHEPAAPTVRPLPMAAHEEALAGVMPLLWVVIAWRAGLMHRQSIELFVSIVLYFTAVNALRSKPEARWQTVRLMLGYLICLRNYWSVEFVVPALRLETWDPALLAVDRALFGRTPGRWMQEMASPLMNDVMSAGYFSYLIYFNGVLLTSLRWSPERMHRFIRPLLMVFIAGFIGYLIIPARGPRYVFAELFTTSVGGVDAGGWLTRTNQLLVSSGTTVYDVFPSLHLAVGWTVLYHDWRFARLRFFFALPWVALLTISTVYLRYHYGIDLIAGAALMGAVVLWDSHLPQSHAYAVDPQAPPPRGYDTFTIPAPPQM